MDEVLPKAVPVEVLADVRATAIGHRLALGGASKEASHGVCGEIGPAVRHFDPGVGGVHDPGGVRIRRRDDW